MSYIINDISNDWPKYNKRAGMPPMRDPKSIDMIVIHCTGDEDLTGKDVDSIIKYHTNPNHVCATGCWTICYGYYIEKVKGQVTVWNTVPDNIVTFHAGIWNKRSIGVVIDKREGDQLTDDELLALSDTLSLLCDRYGINPYLGIWGHRHLIHTGWTLSDNLTFVTKKTCPGVLLENYSFDTLRGSVAQRMIDAYGWDIRNYQPDDVLIHNGEMYLTEDARTTLATNMYIKKKV